MVMDAKYRKQKWQVYFWRPEFLGLSEPETLEEVEQQFRYIPSLAARPDPLFRGLAAEMHNELVRQSSSCPSLLKDYGNLIEQERERRESIFHFSLLGEEDEANHEFNEVFIEYAGEHGLIAYGRDAKIALMPDGRILKPALSDVLGERPLPAKEEVFQKIFRGRVLELLEPLGFSERLREGFGEKVLARDVEGGCHVVKPLVQRMRNGTYEANIFIDVFYDDIQLIVRRFEFTNKSEVCGMDFERLFMGGKRIALVSHSDLESMLGGIDKYLVPFLERISTREGLAALMVGDEQPVFRDHAQRNYVASCLILARLSNLPDFDGIVNVLRQKGAVRWTTPPSKDLRENFERLVAHLREGVTS